MIKGRCAKQVNVKNEDGKVSTEKIEVCESWNQYFEGQSMCVGK